MEKNKKTESLGTVTHKYFSKEIKNKNGGLNAFISEKMKDRLCYVKST